MGRVWARVGVLEGRARARSLPVLVNSPRRPHPARFWSSVGASIPAGGVSIACAGRLRIAEPKGAAGAAQWAKQGVTFCPPRTSLAPAPAPAAAADTCWPIMWLMRRAARGAGLRAARGGVTLSKAIRTSRGESLGVDGMRGVPMPPACLAAIFRVTRGPVLVWRQGDGPVTDQRCPRSQAPDPEPRNVRGAALQLVSYSRQRFRCQESRMGQNSLPPTEHHPGLFEDLAAEPGPCCQGLSACE